MAPARLPRYRNPRWPNTTHPTAASIREAAGHEPVRPDEAQLIRSQRSTIAKLSEVVKLADFMAFLMVLARRGLPQ